MFNSSKLRELTANKEVWDPLTEYLTHLKIQAYSGLRQTAGAPQAAYFEGRLGLLDDLIQLPQTIREVDMAEAEADEIARIEAREQKLRDAQNDDGF